MWASGPIAGTIGRPLIGYVNLCIPNWQSLTSVLMHELVHIIGFNTDFFTYSFPNFALYDTIGRQQGAVAFAREHFGCGPSPMTSPFDDMLIRGIPTSVAGHMDPFIMGDDFMAPCIGPGLEYRFTELTARIIGDLGYTNAQTGVFSPFYQINHTAADKMLYGYMRGCSFAPDACDASLEYPAHLMRCVELCLDTPVIVPTTMEGAIALSDRSVILAWHGLEWLAPSSSLPSTSPSTSSSPTVYYFYDYAAYWGAGGGIALLLLILFSVMLFRGGWWFGLPCWDEEDTKGSYTVLPRWEDRKGGGGVR
jgi:hypothetical protein